MARKRIVEPPLDDELSALDDSNRRACERTTPLPRCSAAAADSFAIAADLCTAPSSARFLRWPLILLKYQP